MSENREYRSFNFIERAKTEEPEYICEGYASTFEPYVMGEWEDIEYFERIDEHAFDDADFSDCVFRVDHKGRVYARQSAGTVQLDVDDHGLHTIVDLSKTSSARSLHEDIVAGNYQQMSFAFTIEESSYNKESHTRTIIKIDKVFDIAAVTWPANPTTELSARSKDFFNGVIEEEKAERLNKERCKKAMERINKVLKRENSTDDN